MQPLSLQAAATKLRNILHTREDRTIWENPMFSSARFWIIQDVKTASHESQASNLLCQAPFRYQQTMVAS